MTPSLLFTAGTETWSYGLYEDALEAVVLWAADHAGCPLSEPCSLIQLWLWVWWMDSCQFLQWMLKKTAITGPLTNFPISLEERRTLLTIMMVCLSLSFFNCLLLLILAATHDLLQYNCVQLMLMRFRCHTVFQHCCHADREESYLIKKSWNATLKPAPTFIAAVQL